MCQTRTVWGFFLAGYKCFKRIPREQNVAVTLKIMHLISLLHYSNFNKLYCTAFLYSNPAKKFIY